MKDNSLDGHRGKVALSDTTRNNAPQSSSISTNNSNIVKCDLKSSPGTTGATNDGSTATNFDDDYNEWELGIGDLIIDLDADIEKTNERNGNGQGIPSSHGHHHHHSHHHHHHHSSHHQNGTASSNPGSGGNSAALVDSTPNSSTSAPASTFNFLGSSPPSSSNLAAAMSNSKSPRLSGNSSSSTSASSVSGSGVGSVTSGNASGANSGSGTFEHQATVDKGLKMKIKRKTVGNKYSEAKHEIVQSDTKSAAPPAHPLSENINSSNSSNSCTNSTSGSSSPAASSETPKSKHSSSKGRNSSHREKKEKNRDKDKNSNTRNSNAIPTIGNTNSTEMNGVLSVMSPLKITNSGVSLASPVPPALTSNSSPLPSNGSVASPSMSRSISNSPASCNIGQEGANQQAPSNGPVPLQQQPLQPPASASSSPPMPNLTLKLESKFTSSPLPAMPSVVIKQEDRAASPPLKKVKIEPTDRNGEAECPGSPIPPEMKDTSTCTSVGTITEPDCLGPCEPGTSVMLEGIVWQETEGGVLVVNVTWRGKTYVGTLLDCTKHDWAPPRFCESPTSDVDSKTSKGRGKRGRGGNTSSGDINPFADARNCVQSKLRNGKGRRTTINSNASTSGFTVPNSPAKSENGGTNSKRKSRPADLEISTPPTDNKASKRSRTQNRSTPTSSAPAEFPQPSSPVLIVCPEPNCSKKYKHINGLRYHQTHAHSTSDSSKIDDTTTEDSKDVTNSSDNEESMQESASVSTSPAPSFANSVPSDPTTGKMLLNETALSSSSNMNSLPDSDLFNLTTDLSTLASVAISDSKSEQKVNNSRPVTIHSTVSQELPVVNSDGDDAVIAAGLSVSNPSPNASSIPSPVISTASLSPSSCAGLSTSVSAVTTSVIQSSNSVDSTPISQAVTVSIPTTHVIFNQGLSSSNNASTGYTAPSVVCSTPPNPLSPSRSSLPPSNISSTFPAIPSISNTVSTNPSMLPIMDKNKIKQERPDKYKPKSPSATSAIRPIVPAPTPLLTLSGNLPSSHTSMNIANHAVVGSPLKPIQPKPTTLGEPATVNPALESLKKEKSKHKKKSKDKDKERDKKISSLPLTPIGINPNDECEAMELTAYPSLEAVPGTLPLPGTSHTLSPLVQSKPPETAMDISLPDDSINENIQSPAYSDISDANDTAPVLESEVPSAKEKEDKVGKTTPDTSQSPAANISAYGMYPYYSQPPYLLPSVSPQSAVSGSQGQNMMEKGEINKKSDQERVKESRPWSNPSGESRERQHLEHHEPDKKSSREEGSQSANAIPSPATPSGPVQEYPLQQHYPYPYGYVQGYPYSIEPSYHMHMLESDPHYKQQYKQYIEEQQRLYKEQQHHHQQQQLQQQLHHHQQQQSQHHPHQSHHSQHQSHHQSKSQHHAVAKEERDRSRESKDRSSIEKMSNNGLIVEHSSKIQHSSMSLVSNKDHEVREIDSRPPSLPAQTRLDSSVANSASAAALKEKQNENHQILKENIELKSQMDDSKNKMNQYAMLFEMQREDMRRYYMYQDRVIEQQQQKMEPGIHHHTHHHQTLQPHGHLQAGSYSSSLKPHKEDLSSSIPSHSKSSHYGDNARSSTISPAKSDHVKNPHSNSTSSPKGSIRESGLSSSKEYMSSAASSRESSSSKKDSQSKNSERSESSNREDKKGEKTKVEPKVEPEGQKPTMETTGPPPPPTNSYAYLHPSYLQPAPTHFPHMPFEPAHAMYRGGINPMLVSTPHYGGSPYVHPQIRYVTPGACELPAHSQPPDSLSNKLHPPGPPKALDLLHQVSQHYTTTHKIHELQEHAMMSPTPVSTPSSTPSSVPSSSSGKSSSSEPVVTVAKMEVGGSRDASRSPPTQRHLHTHHHTHVGVTYPIYDPYGVSAQKSYT